MPYKDKEVEKVYYPIGEVASIFGVNTSLIRFWEKEFDIIRPKKNKKNFFNKGSNVIKMINKLYNYPFRPLCLQRKQSRSYVIQPTQIGSP